MSPQQELAEIQRRLAMVNQQIADTQSLLAGANEDQRRELEARIAELQATALTLETMANNLRGGAAAPTR